MALGAIKLVLNRPSGLQIGSICFQCGATGPKRRPKMASRLSRGNQDGPRSPLEQGGPGNSRGSHAT
eukprot:9358593-Pyramimonas_sp.AAC.1